MIYKKFIIEADCEETIGIALDILYDQCDRMMMLTDTMVCINGTYTFSELNNLLLFSNQLTLSVVEIDEKNLNRTLDGFNEYLHRGIIKFIDETNISDNIDYFLDLIYQRGGIEFLSGMEHQRMNELTDDLRKTVHTGS